MEANPDNIEENLDSLEWSKDFVSHLVKIDNLFNIFEITKD